MKMNKGDKVIGSEGGVHGMVRCTEWSKGVNPVNHLKQGKEVKGQRQEYARGV